MNTVNEFDNKIPDEVPANSAENTPPASPAAAPRQGLLQRKLFFGLSLPWLAGAVLVLLASGWYLFAPDGEPDVNQMAFGTADVVSNAGSVPPSSPPLALSAGSPSPDLTHLQDDVAGMVKGVRDYAQANRDAITRLASTVKAQGETINTLSGQVSDLKTQISELLTRQTIQEAATASSPAAVRKVATQTPLAGMSLVSIQDGMAWVRWQGKTWAVKRGDRLGSITITSVNATDRQVQTSAGLLKDQ